GRGALDVQLDTAVVDQQPIAFRDGREEVLERTRHASVATNEVAALDRQSTAGFDAKGFGHRPRADLRTAQILQNRDVAAHLARDRANQRAGGNVIVGIAVGEVETERISASGNQGLDGGRIVRGGADRSKNAGATHVGAYNQQTTGRN